VRKIAIIGIGQTPVREHWNLGIRELAAEAIFKALDDAGIKKVDALFVGNMLSGALSNQEHLGSLVAEYAGLEGIEAIKVEAACASGAAAFRQAVLAVASGNIDYALAVGVEKLTDLSGYFTTNGLATAADADYEAAMGLSFVALNALLMKRYMFEYKFSKQDFAEFIINAHRNAIHNPNAMYRKTISTEQYLNSKMVVDPINLLDASPIADGAAAAIVCTYEESKSVKSKPIIVSACEIGTDTIAIYNRKNPLILKGVERSTQKAIRTAGIKHSDLDFLELHDAFSIMTALSLEASGFADYGMGLRIPDNGKIKINGSLPLSTFGGLKARGHPVGATGIYQINEAVLQLRHEAPEAIQIEDARYAFTQNIGGSGATVVTTILERDHK
jgi:acetyl-CoA C-acetyltransferase